MIYPGIVTNIEQGKSARSLFLKKDIDILVIVNLTYTTSEVAHSVIRGLDKPILVWNSSLLRGLDIDNSLVKLSLEHGPVGTNELTSILKRIDYPHYYIISGLMDKDSTYKKLAPYLEAARIVKLLKKAGT